MNPKLDRLRQQTFAIVQPKRRAQKRLSWYFCLRAFHEVADKLLLGEGHNHSEVGLGLKALPPRSLSQQL